MKHLSSIKTVPAVALLGLSLALSPVFALADKDDRGDRKQRHDRYEHVDRHDRGKAHHHDNRHKASDHGRPGHHHTIKRYDDRHHKVYRPERHVIHKYTGHGHKHHGKKHHGHRNKTVYIYDAPVVTTRYVHRHYSYGSGLDRLSLMLGLHFDNMDIIFHD